MCFNVSFHFTKLIMQGDLQRFRPEFRALYSIMRQILAKKTTAYDSRHGSFVTNPQLCHSNNGVCCGHDSKTISRPASITILFKRLPYKNNTLVIMNVLQLAMSSGRKWLSFKSTCDVT